MNVNTLHHPEPAPALAGPMSRRRLLVGLVAAPLVAAFVTACGDDTVDPGSGDTPETSTPGTSAPGTPGTPGTSAPGAIAHPTGADTAVVRIAWEGGFVPVETMFVNQPTLLVSGDGRAFTPGAVPAIYPGPLVMPMGVRTISETGIQTLLRLAQDQGLLAPPPDYAADMNVADAPDTVVTITTDDGTWEHRAYALGLDGTGTESTPARQALAAFVTAATDLASAVGAAELGPESLFEPAEYRLRAIPADEASLAGLDPAPTFVDWPTETGLDLAAAGECARLGADVVGSLFSDATQLTYFRTGDAVYGLAVAGVLPGDPAC